MGYPDEWRFFNNTRMQLGKRIVALLVAIAAERGRGVVVVTHDPRILDAADRIVRIEDGRIVHTETRRDRQDTAP